MKTQIEINDQLWNDLKAKVNADGKTLREVVPTVLEPALRAYVERTTITPPPPPSDTPQVIPEPKKAPPVPAVRRCELCDMPSERLFASGPYKVCYSCWKGALVNSNDRSSEPSSSASGSS